MAVLNTGILKAPQNWALVAFSIVLLLFVSHFIVKGFNNNGD